MTAYPVFFGFREVVQGKGYLAGVEAYCRALVREVDGCYWATSLNPGGVTAKGNNPYLAADELKREISGAFAALAEIEASIQAFVEHVNRVFNQPKHQALEAEWEEAVKRVRADEVNLPIGRVPADRKPWVRVVELVPSEAAPSHNKVPEEAALAA